MRVAAQDSSASAPREKEEEPEHPLTTRLPRVSNGLAEGTEEYNAVTRQLNGASDGNRLSLWITTVGSNLKSSPQSNESQAGSNPPYS
ncbi:MAG: hypothetical protein NTNFB01_10240 [Nitrospira sp.]